MIPRCLPCSLSVDVANYLGAPPEQAAVAALVQAVITVALGTGLLKLAGVTSAAARGVAAGATAGVVGTAAVAHDDPTSLADGGLAYAFTGVLMCVVMAVPAVREVISAIVAVKPV
jgi:putative effector of murein hydrolase